MARSQKESTDNRKKSDKDKKEAQGKASRLKKKRQGTETVLPPEVVASAAALVAGAIATHLSLPADTSPTKKKRGVSEHSLKNLQILVESERGSAPAGGRVTQRKYWYYQSFAESTYVRAYFLRQNTKPSPGSPEESAIARLIQDMFERIKEPE